MGASQHNFEVSHRVAVYIGLHNGVSVAFEPGHAMADNVRILAAKCKCLVSAIDAATRGGIDRRQVDDIDTVEEVGYDIRRGRGAICNCSEYKFVGAKPTRENVRAATANESVVAVEAHECVRGGRARQNVVEA